MEFNLQKFLVENKLTKRSFLKEVEEEDPTLGAETGEETGEEEMYGDEPEDTWYKDDSGDSSEFEKEPVAKDIKGNEPALTGIHQKQAELSNLEAKKDALLMQLRSGQLSLDQYKAAIGNIPMLIKKLRADIEQTMSVDAGEDEGELA